MFYREYNQSSAWLFFFAFFFLFLFFGYREISVLQGEGENCAYILHEQVI